MSSFTHLHVFLRWNIKEECCRLNCFGYYCLPLHEKKKKHFSNVISIFHKIKKSTGSGHQGEKRKFCNRLTIPLKGSGGLCIEGSWTMDICLSKEHGKLKTAQTNVYTNVIKTFLLFLLSSHKRICICSCDCLSWSGVCSDPFMRRGDLHNVRL